MEEVTILFLILLSWIEVVLLTFYNLANSFLTLFFPKLFFEKVKKGHYVKLKTIYFICYLFLVFKTLLGWSITMIFIGIFIKIFSTSNNVEFLNAIIPNNNIFEFLALILLLAELLRNAVLDIDVYVVFKKCCKFFKKWNFFSKNEVKKIENKNI